MEQQRLPPTLGSSAFVDGFLLIRHGRSSHLHRNSITFSDPHPWQQQTFYSGTDSHCSSRPRTLATSNTAVQTRAQPRSVEMEMEINRHQQQQQQQQQQLQYEDDKKYCGYIKSHSLTVCLVPPQSFGDEKHPNNNQPLAGSSSIQTIEGNGNDSGGLSNGDDGPMEIRNNHNNSSSIFIDNDGVWKALTNMRVELRDPGLYRWPPHVNLLYPFVQEDGIDDGTIRGKEDRGRDNPGDSTTTAPTPIPTTILAKLRRAAKQVEPFWVSLDLSKAPNDKSNSNSNSDSNKNYNTCYNRNTRSGFGTFGGSNRGVLWVYPESFRNQNTSTSININITNNTIAETTAPTTAAPTTTTATISSPLENWEIDNANNNEPIVDLQSLLEDEFPMCSERLKARRFLPHMTLSSKFDSREGAFAAGAALGSASMTAATNGTSTLTTKTTTTTIIPRSPLLFWCKEFYLLERDGPNGQFKRRATFALGNNSSTRSNRQQQQQCISDGVLVHDPPLRFPGMPLFEAPWVRSELEALKVRRKTNQKTRRRGGSGTRKSYRARKKERRAADDAAFSDGAATVDGDMYGRKAPPLPPPPRPLWRHDTVEEIDRKRAERKARREGAAKPYSDKGSSLSVPPIIYDSMDNNGIDLRARMAIETRDE